MIKTVQGIIEKLTSARDKGYKYCKVAVDNNNIGCVLIKDILDSIEFCHTPRGRIRTFIHRGYEYTVYNGIEITILSDKDFGKYYLGIRENKDISRTEADKEMEEVIEPVLHENVDTSSLTKEEMEYLNGILEVRDALLRRNSPSKPSLDFNVGETVRLKSQTTDKGKEGFFNRFKNWLKGDVRYRR